MKYKFNRADVDVVVEDIIENGKKYEVITYNDIGLQEWRLNGKLHREKGPAHINRNFKAWFQDGDWHCLHGPAAVFSNGRLQWAIYDKQVTEEQYRQIKRKIKTKTILALNLDRI
jgi:hypothetical protein